MRRGTICLLVLGLANLLTATEIGLDNLPQSEIKEIEAEISKGNTPPDYTPSDKAKRGVAKLSNADNPGFNHLSVSSSSGASTVKTSTVNNQTPYRYLYNNNQYYQSNPFISYVQSPQAAQIATQYSFQPSPLAHYLQTPTQIQYVSTPNLGSRYQVTGSKVGASTAGATVTGTAATTQYHIAPAQQLYLAPQALYQGQTTGSAAHSASSSSSSSSSSSTSSSAASQYQTPHQLYYQQQPIVMLLVQQQPNPAALLYPLQQQQQAAYVIGQNPFLNIYGNHRFSLPYTAAQNSQITYLVPMAVQTTPQQGSVGVKSAAEKTTSSIQTSSGVSYGVRTTKA